MGFVCLSGSNSIWLVLLFLVCFFSSSISEAIVFRDVSCGTGHSIAISNNGTIFLWGFNKFGELGDGTTKTDKFYPVPMNMTGILSGKNITQACGAYYTIALSSDGNIFSWGYNAGQLGDGTIKDRLSPVSVNMSGVLNGKNIIQVAAGESHTIAVSSDGYVFSWGFNDNGQLGDGTTTNRLNPGPVNMTGVLDGKNITQVSAGYLTQLLFQVMEISFHGE